MTAEQEAFKVAMQALSEANVRLNESMLAQERESETRRLDWRSLKESSVRS